MALSTVTVTFDLHQLLGEDFDARRTRAYVKTNVANKTLIDTSTGETRIGDQKVTIGDDGTGSFSTWAPGADGNPVAWQTYFVVEYPRIGQRDRQVRTFGPWTIAASGTLASLEEEQAVPAEYLTQVTDELQTYSDAAEVSATSAAASATSAAASATTAVNAKNQASEIALGDADATLAAAIENPASDTYSALSASYLRRAPRILYPEDFGAVGDGVTDDTLAFRAMVDAALDINADSGECHFVFQMAPVTYLLAGAPTAPDGAGGAYAQIPLPKRAISVANVLVLEFKGRGYTKGETPDGLTILRSTSNAVYDPTLGLPSVIGGPARGTVDESLSVLNVTIEGLVVRRNDNPSIAGIDLSRCFTARTRNLTLDTAMPGGVWGNAAVPTHTSNIALLMPGLNNNAVLTCEGETIIVGAYVGIEFGEHFQADHVLMFRCVNALAPVHHNHGSVITHANLEHCMYLMAGHSLDVGVVPAPFAYITIPLLAIEDAQPGNDFAPLGHIADDDDKLRLDATYMRVIANDGPTKGALIVTGGAQVTLTDLNDRDWHLVGETGEPAFQNAWVNFGGGETPAAFRKIGNRVELRGLIKSGGVDAAAFTLPAGFRPRPIGGSTSGAMFPVVSNGVFGRVVVDTGGQVLVLSPSTATYVALGSVSFTV